MQTLRPSRWYATPGVSLLQIGIEFETFFVGWFGGGQDLNLRGRHQRAHAARLTPPPNPILCQGTIHLALFSWSISPSHPINHPCLKSWVPPPRYLIGPSWSSTPTLLVPKQQHQQQEFLHLHLVLYFVLEVISPVSIKVIIHRWCLSNPLTTTDGA